MNYLFVTTKDRKNRRSSVAWAAITACVTGLGACVFLLPAQSCSAQSTDAKYPWQKMQMPTAAEVATAWKNPPSEYGPEPYFGMNGAVTIESLAHDLDTAKSIGFRAVTVQAGNGMATPYLTPEYFAFFKQFAEEAKKRDMRIWIVDDLGYPSGFAGGLISKQTPELRMQALSLSPGIAVKAGESLNQAVSANAVSAVAVRTTGDDHMSIALKDGKIAWTAPTSGDWTVYVVEHVFRTSPVKGGGGPGSSLEDYMDPAATAAYIGFTHQGYYNVMPELFGNTILGFRGDEPDYSIGGLPWTPKFFESFQQLKGYDVRPYLGVLVMSKPQQSGFGGKPATPPPAAPKLTDAEQRAMGDYADVFSQMFRDGFFKPQGVWCAAHGVEYQVHINHEEAEMQLVRSQGEFVRDMKYVEVPGIDAIWHQIWTDTITDYPRLASSAAHIYGHPRSFTESFAAYRPEPDVAMARYILNEQMVRGINVIETMMFAATRPAGAPPEPERPRPPVAPTAAGGTAAPAPPQRPRGGGPSNLMRDPAWPALMDYVHRLSYVMSMGRPAASVALYIPSSSMWLDDSAADTAYVATERLLAERQIDFDIINIDALATDLKAGPGYLETMSGNQYRTVVIPYADVLSQAEVDRLKALVKGGGKVLFLGKTPTLISQKSIMDSRVATPADFAFATVETSVQLPQSPRVPSDAPAAPPGPQVVQAAIATALNKVIGTREVALDAPDPALKVNTRRLKDADVYLFFNEGAQASSHTVTLKTAGKGVEEWDPATGSVSPVTSTAGKGVMTVKLELKPYATELLTVR
ncbi:MAG: glycosyl hydrolase [Acidobacteriaceae bacterium]